MEVGELAERANDYRRRIGIDDSPRDGETDFDALIELAVEIAGV